MATPARFRAALLAALTEALPAIVDDAWRRLDTPKPSPSADIRRREATDQGRRMAKNRLRAEVKELISQNDQDGLSLAEIRRLLPHQVESFSEHTLKRALQALRARGEIETRNSRWHLAPPLYQKGRH